MILWNYSIFTSHVMNAEAIMYVLTFGVSTQLQSFGLVAHENRTFRKLALAVSVPFMA